MTGDEQTDVLIIGAGIAGIRAAIEAHDRGADVVLTTKGALCKDGASTWMAGNAFQAALYPPDSVDTHVLDTLRGGKYLNNQRVVNTFLSRGPQEVDTLHGWGARFLEREGKFFQISFPGHSHPRSVCGKPGFFLGPEYKKALYRQVRKRKIRVREDLFLTDLLYSGQRVAGAIGLDLRKGETKTFQAKTTVLATGGFMACYELTTANPTATGDGHAMAYRAGARMMDMEFVQFIPSATLWPRTLYGNPYPYLLWVLLHPVFYNSLGERFLERYYPDVKDWANREAVARAIVKEVRGGRGSPHGGAYMSFRHLPRNLLNHFLEKARGVDYLEKWTEAGFDLREDAIEVAPGAHYVQGGCWIDERCATNLENLYAVGEVGSGGKDGADRLAGNSITFCLAMGAIAGQEAAARAEKTSLIDLDGHQISALSEAMVRPLNARDGERPREVKATVRRVMSGHAFLERDEQGLKTALKSLEEIQRRDLHRLSTVGKHRIFNLEWVEALEAMNMVAVAALVCHGALARQESRGLHQRMDYPRTDPLWLKHVILRRQGEGVELSTEATDVSLITPESPTGP